MQDASRPQWKYKVKKKLFQQERSNNLNYHAQGGGVGVVAGMGVEHGVPPGRMLADGEARVPLPCPPIDPFPAVSDRES